MKYYIKLAWRNIWRNKRRTLITIASIFFAVFFALIMRAFQLGTYQNMTNNVVEAFTGYVQIHGKDFWKERTIDYTFALDDSLLKTIEEKKGVLLAVPRLETFALASAGEMTKGAMVCGIDPEKEQQMTKLKNKIIRYKLTNHTYTQLQKEGLSNESIDILKKYRRQSFATEEELKNNLYKLIGEELSAKYIETVKSTSEFKNEYLSNTTPGVIIGEKLASYLKLSPGDTLVLIGQGYHGVSAAGKYPVRAITWLPNPDLDNKMVYMDLKSCQELYNAENRVTALSINLENPEDFELIKTELQSELQEDKFEVMTWKEMLTELVQGIESDNYSGLIMLYVLYVVIGFGVFGTVLMMTAERRKEFGVLVAIGMQKRKLSFIVFIELLMLIFIGILAGIVGSLPVIGYYHLNPIELSGEMATMMEQFGVEPVMPMALQVDYMIAQSSAVFIIIILAIIYPLLKILGLNVMKSIRS